MREVDCGIYFPMLTQSTLKKFFVLESLEQSDSGDFVRMGFLRFYGLIEIIRCILLRSVIREYVGGIIGCRQFCVAVMLWEVGYGVSSIGAGWGRI